VLYGAARALAGRPAPATLDYGSFNFHGAVADALAAATPITTLAAIAGVTLIAARAGDDVNEGALLRRVVCASIAAATALWLTGKVFSPQYLTWALPLVIAVPSDRVLRPRVRRVIVAFLAALFLGQLFWRGYYDHVYGQRPAGILTLVARQAALVWLVVLTMRCVNENGILRVRVGGTRPVR
jgi:hypothetical protein